MCIMVFHNEEKNGNPDFSEKISGFFRNGTLEVISDNRFLTYFFKKPKAATELKMFRVSSIYIVLRYSKSNNVCSSKKRTKRHFCEFLLNQLNIF